MGVITYVKDHFITQHGVATLRSTTMFNGIALSIFPACTKTWHQLTPPKQQREPPQNSNYFQNEGWLGCFQNMWLLHIDGRNSLANGKIYESLKHHQIFRLWANYVQHDPPLCLKANLCSHWSLRMGRAGRSQRTNNKIQQCLRGCLFSYLGAIASETNHPHVLMRTFWSIKVGCLGWG